MLSDERLAEIRQDDQDWRGGGLESRDYARNVADLLAEVDRLRAAVNVGDAAKVKQPRNRRTQRALESLLDAIDRAAVANDRVRTARGELRKAALATPSPPS